MVALGELFGRLLAQVVRAPRRVAALAGGIDDKTADLGGIVLMRQVDGKRMAAAYDLRQVRKGVVDDPLIYGDDIIVIEQSASKTALRRFIEAVPALGIFNVL